MVRRSSGEYNPRRESARVPPHIPRRNACASASARSSSSQSRQRPRALTRARPSRTSTALTKRPSSRTTYARWPPRTPRVGPSGSRRTQRRSTSAASRSRASRANGAAVSKPWELRRVDAEQPHASDRRDLDRVAVDHRAHHDGWRRCEAAIDRRCLMRLPAAAINQTSRICIRDSSGAELRGSQMRGAIGRTGRKPDPCQSPQGTVADRARASRSCRASGVRARCRSRRRG